MNLQPDRNPFRMFTGDLVDVDGWVEIITHARFVNIINSSVF